MQLTSLRHAVSRKNNNREGKIALIIFSLCFFAGSAIGSMLGYPYQWIECMADGYLYENSAKLGLFLSFLWSIRFHLLAMIIGTSFLGSAFLLPLVLVRAYLLSCASATIISAYPKSGIVMALIIIGLPALLSVPSFIALSSEALSASVNLLHMRTGTHCRYSRGYGRTCFICLFVMILCTLVEIKLVPYIILLLNK